MASLHHPTSHPQIQSYPEPWTGASPSCIAWGNIRGHRLDAGPRRGGVQEEPQAGVRGGGEGAHHSVKSKSEEHQEKDDGPERREGQPG